MVSGHPGQPFIWVLLVAGDDCPRDSRAGSRAPACTQAVGEGALPWHRELRVCDQAGSRLGCRRIGDCFERLICHQC